MDTEPRTKEYEIAFLLRDEKGLDLVREAVRRGEGEMILENPGERIALAYKIEKESAAHFGYFHFRMDPARLADLRRDLDARSEILRFLIITPPFVKTKPRSPFKPKTAPGPEGEDRRPSAPPPAMPLSNEALEKKIEEILQQ